MRRNLLPGLRYPIRGRECQLIPVAGGRIEHDCVERFNSCALVTAAPDEGPWYDLSSIEPQPRGALAVEANSPLPGHDWLQRTRVSLVVSDFQRSGGPPLPRLKSLNLLEFAAADSGPRPT